MLTNLVCIALALALALGLWLGALLMAQGTAGERMLAKQVIREGHYLSLEDGSMQYTPPVWREHPSIWCVPDVPFGECGGCRMRHHIKGEIARQNEEK